MAEVKNAQNENPKQEEKEEKKKKGVIVGVIGLAAAAAVAVPLALKGCAPGERSFTVTFLTDEEVQGFQQGSMNVKDGTTIGSLKNQLAPLEGYDIEGLYKDAGCEHPFADSDVVNENTKIYIAYEEKKYTLKFYNEGDALDGDPIATIDVYYYKTIKQSLAIDGKDTSMPHPTKTEGDFGYEFTGWQVFGNTEKVFHNKDFQTMKGKDILELDADGEAELIATFAAKKENLYTVTYDENVLEVRKGNEPIKTGDKVLSGSRLTIVSKYGELKDDFFMNLQVNGANLVEEDELYYVTGNVSIEASIEHRYLTFNKLSDGTYEVTGRNDETIDVVIPAYYYDGSKITSINASGFFTYGSSNSLTFGENITSIKGTPFLSGQPKEVNFLGTVDQWASIDFSNTWVCSPLSYGATTFKIKGEVLTEATINVDISGYAFYYVKTLTKVTIGENCKSIGDSAFDYCSGLTSVVIGNSVTSIGNNAFYHCDSLESAIIGNGVTSIGEHAFDYCSSLTEIVIPDSVTSIGIYAFQECSGLESVVIGNNVTGIGNRTFENCRSLTSVVIGNSVTSIGDYAFDYCSSLASIVIPDNVISIGNGAFYRCSGLKEVYYTGTSEGWNKISISSGAGNNDLKSAIRYYFSESPNYDGEHWHWSDPDASGVRTPVIWGKEND